jgi:catechol 2,3-dioxygenase-like lactoylglutathione lyase family enzyme
VILRVNDLKLMKWFYLKVLGLDLLGEFPSALLLRVGDGSGAGVQMIGLLQRSVGLEPESNSIEHVALVMQIQDHELQRKRLEGLGLRVDAIRHAGIGKRSLCFSDPEGNQVELLCCGPALEA